MPVPCYVIQEVRYVSIKAIFAGKNASNVGGAVLQYAVESVGIPLQRPTLRGTDIMMVSGNLFYYMVGRVCSDV